MTVSGVGTGVILQYMEIRSRLRFSVDNSGFRQIEKSFPLNINTLKLKEKSFNIDGMEFDGTGNFHYDTEGVIQEGWKSLIEMVFSGRGNFLEIQKLVVHPCFENPSESLKLNVKNLVLVPWMDFRAVRDLISEKSLPLESVEAHLSCYKRHKIFDTAGILKLTVGTNDHPEVMVANPRVHFNCKDGFAVPIAIALFYKYHPDIERKFTFNVRGDRDWIWILRDFGNDQLRRQWLEIEHQDNIQMHFPYKSDSGVLLDFTFNRVPTSFHPDGRFKSRKYHQICISINPKNMSLSRVGQEVVLQYMDIKSRMRLSLRNPGFQKFEKSYPLHIENLCLREKGFQVDDILFRLVPDDVEYKDMKMKIVNERELREELSKGRRKPKKIIRIEHTRPLQEAFKDLMETFFGGRGQHIHVRHLEVLDGFKNQNKTIKMQVDHLDVQSTTEMSNVNDLISTDSLPLETARTNFHAYQDHRLLASAKLLILEIRAFIIVFDGRKFSNTRIHFECTKAIRSALAIAMYFKKENPAIKRHFTFEVLAKHYEWNNMVQIFADEETKNHFIERGFAFPMTFTIKTDAGADLKLSADKKDDSIVTFDLELIA